MFPPKSRWPIIFFAAGVLLSGGCVDPSPSRPFAGQGPWNYSLPPHPVNASANSEPLAGASAQVPATGQEPVPPASPAQVPTAQAARVTAVADPAAKLRDLYQQAATRFAGIDSYIARLRRREQVHGKDQPEELMRFMFRKQPWSVYFKWLGEAGKGREVVYVKGQHGNMLHTLLAAGDMPLMPAGKRMALAPDNVFVKSASRHAITEAGIGVIIEQFGRALKSQEDGRNSFGVLVYRGPTKRPEYDRPLETVEQQIPPGCEPPLPKGGRRWVFFDPANNLPVLLITHDDKEHEVEYYCYDLVQYPVKLDDSDFNPELLWPSARK
jgi:hypothetical protein